MSEYISLLQMKVSVKENLFYRFCDVIIAVITVCFPREEIFCSLGGPAPRVFK